MKIVQITAGTGNYHCDTCLRDHALVRALRRLGHDVLMVPLYLPLVTEIPDDDHLPIFLGGINAYLQQKFAVFRHTPEWVDRLFDARWLLKTASGFADMTQPRELGEITVSTLKGLHGNQRKELARLLHWLTQHYPDLDVIMLSNALLLGFAKPLGERFGAPVICTLQGSDYFIEGLPEPYRAQSWDLLRGYVNDAAGLIAVSQYYGDLMAGHLRIPPAKLHIVRNGIDLQDFAGLKRTEAAPTIGFLSQMTPLKGLEDVVDAFIRLRRDPRLSEVRLRIGGSIVPAWRPFIHAMERRLADAGLAGAVSFEEILERPAKLAFLAAVSVFTVPIRFGEPFGVYAAEAMAAGTPVVEPARGALPELIELTGGGLCYPPDDPDGLVNALSELLLDPDRRRAMGEAGRQAISRHFPSDRMAADVVRAIELSTP